MTFLSQLDVQIRIYIYIKLELCFKHKRHLLSLDLESYIFPRGGINICFSTAFNL